MTVKSSYESASDKEMMRELLFSPKKNIKIIEENNQICTVIDLIAAVARRSDDAVALLSGL